MRRLIEYDEVAGIATYHHYDESEDKTYIETVQDVEPYLELNKKLQNENELSELARRKNLVRVGSIPITVQMEWMQKFGIKDIYAPEYRKKVLSLLNDPDYKYLKTVTGRL